ncbi:hypothetical protein TELCIR_06067 [Teladorsagia circumcincta]|uniref:Uncharacterized protein n=1 Tax=Teladorsagia circumcincta TaxID=45464 RepID=A0A2G9UQM6_TELCI|nr:hypothetical protein TELCIR_06067 [Teladorsagia circumcincta]
MAWESKSRSFFWRSDPNYRYRNCSNCYTLPTRYLTERKCYNDYCVENYALPSNCVTLGRNRVRCTKTDKLSSASEVPPARKFKYWSPSLFVSSGPVVSFARAHTISDVVLVPSTG